MLVARQGAARGPARTVLPGGRGHLQHPYRPIAETGAMRRPLSTDEAEELQLTSLYDENFAQASTAPPKKKALRRRGARQGKFPTRPK